MTQQKNDTKRRQRGGLTMHELVQVAGREIPTHQLGDVFRRLPARFYDQESERFRPIAPAVLVAMALYDPADRMDEHVADLVELASMDPSPEVSAWSITVDGERVPIGIILQRAAKRLAELYRTPA